MDWATFRSLFEDAFVKNVLLGVVTPALMCALVLVIAWRPWRAGGAATGGRWGAPVGLVLCFCLALTATESWGWPAFPPHESWQWLAYLMPAAGLWGLFECIDRVPMSVRFGGRLAMAGLTGWLIAGSWVDHVWWWRPIGAVLVLVLGAGLDPLARRCSGARLPLALCASLGGTAVLLVLAENARLSQIAGALAGALTAVVCLAWWRPTVHLGRGAVAPVAVAIPGLLLSGHFVSYAGVPAWAFPMLAMAPLAAWMGEVGPIARLRPWLRAIVCVIAVMVPIAVAIFTAYMATMEPRT